MVCIHTYKGFLMAIAIVPQDECNHIITYVVECNTIGVDPKGHSGQVTPLLLNKHALLTLI